MEQRMRQKLLTWSCYVIIGHKQDFSEERAACPQKCSLNFFFNLTKKVTLCHFYQRFMCSFCTCGSRKRKKDWQLDCLFVLSGSAGIKAAHRTLTKLTPNLKCHKLWQKQKYTLFFIYLSVELSSFFVAFMFNRSQQS